MDATLHKNLNEHIKLEFQAWRDYHAMALWLELHDLPGMATWVAQQSADELTHAQRIIDHLTERDLEVELADIPAPPQDWKDVTAMVEDVLKSEQRVTASINDLYALAEKVGDRPAQIMLQWFVSEQVEEENAARALLGRLKLAGSSGVGLLMIDQELATGKIPGAMEETE